MSERQPGLRERKKSEVRRAILKAAEDLFRQHGYHETSMSQIAEAANISRKTLFNYCDNKETIVLNLVDAFIGEHMPDWLEEAVPLHGDARDILTDNVWDRLDVIASHRWLLTLAANHTGFFSFGQTAYVAETLQANVSSRERRIAMVQQNGKIRSDISAGEISRYYEALRDLVIRNWLVDETLGREDLHRMFDHAMKVLIRGLEPDSTVPSSLLP